MKYELTDNLPTTIEMLRADALIGNDYYTYIVSMQQTEITDTLHLLGSKIGWILTGRTKLNDFINKKLIMLTKSTSIFSQFEACSKDDESITNNVQPHLKEFWKLAAIGVKESCKETDIDKALENINQAVEHKEGKYHVQWLWKEDSPKLQDNYQLAHGAFIKVKVNGKRGSQDIWSDSTRLIEEGHDWDGWVKKTQFCVGALHPNPHCDKAKQQHN